MNVDLDRAAGLVVGPAAAACADESLVPAVLRLVALVDVIGGGGSFAEMRDLVPVDDDGPAVAAVLGLLGPSGAALAGRAVDGQGAGAVEAAAAFADAVAKAVGGGRVDVGMFDGWGPLAGGLAGGLEGGGSSVSWVATRRAGALLARDRRALVRSAVMAAAGRPDRVGWPTAKRLVPRALRTDPPLAGRLDDGVWAGNLPGLPVALGAGCDAVVSLCRIGTHDVPADVEVAEFRLVDDAAPAANPNVDFVIGDAADTVELFVGEGRTVYLHCHGGRSRSAAVAAVVLARRHDLSAAAAYRRVAGVLPEATDERLGRAVRRVIDRRRAGGA